MHSGEGVQNHDRHAVWSVREVRERAHANSQKACQMSVRCRGGLSRGGGACPMCRLSDGEERGTAQWWREDTECYAERDCRHAETQQHTYVLPKAAAEKAVREVRRREWQELPVCVLILRSRKNYWFPKFTFLFVSDVLILKITKVRGLAICNRAVLLKTCDMWLCDRHDPSAEPLSSLFLLESV